MKGLLLTLALSSLTGLALADTVTVTFQPSPADLSDLDHHQILTWRVGGLNWTGKTVLGAQLLIKNIRNWDSNPNRLFLHLLDTAVYSGVRSFFDDNPAHVPVTDITDDFVNARYHGGTDARGYASPWIVAAGTADTFLAAPSFGTSSTNYLYTFTAAQASALLAYVINGGNFALGFDPDCHYYNDGVKLVVKLGTAPATPEPATALLLALGGAAFWVHRRRSAAR